MSKYDNNFYNIEDLIECLSRGCEVEFLYRSKKYAITPISEGVAVYEYNNVDSEKVYTDIKKIAEHKIDDKKLCDIIDDMKVIFRCF